MQDKLKQYVEEHREELEIYQPREHLWEGVNEQLHHGRHRIRWQRLTVAASILLVLTCGTWAFIANRQHRAAEVAVQAQPPLREAEVYFTHLVQLKDAELEQYCNPQPELCREFEGDLSALSDAYHQLKAEYATAADRQAILRAMAANLQMQVQLISQQLQVMETVQQKRREFNTI